MIALTDLHGRLFFINADMIEKVESTPDTQIVLSNSHVYYVKEKPEEVIKRVIEFRRQCTIEKEKTDNKTL